MVNDAFTTSPLQPADQDGDTIGETRVLVMGFGALGAAALAQLAFRSEPGLKLLPAADTAQIARDALSAESSPSPLLDGAHVLALLVDESDAAQTRMATAVAQASNRTVSLVMGVILSKPCDLDTLMQDIHARRNSEDFAASVRHVVRLELHDDEGFPADASAVLQTLTADIACLCNKQHFCAVDFEDFMSVMSRPGPLAVNIGSASGPERANSAVSSVMARTWPVSRSERLDCNVMLIVSSSSTTFRFSEAMLVINAVRLRLGSDQHLIFAGVQSDEMGDRLQVALLVTPNERNE